MRGAAFALIIAVATAGGCKFAVQHPPIAAGIVGGVMGLGTCEMAGGTQKQCFSIGGGAAALLGLVAWVAILAGGDGNTVLNEPMTKTPDAWEEPAAAKPERTPEPTPMPMPEPEPTPMPMPEPTPTPTPMRIPTPTPTPMPTPEPMPIRH